MPDFAEEYEIIMICPPLEFHVFLRNESLKTLWLTRLLLSVLGNNLITSVSEKWELEKFEK